MWKIKGKNRQNTINKNNLGLVTLSNIKNYCKVIVTKSAQY